MTSKQKQKQNKGRQCIRRMVERSNQAGRQARAHVLQKIRRPKKLDLVLQKLDIVLQNVAL